MTRFYKSPSFWVTTLLTIFAIAPLLRPGYFWAAHDARHDVYFILQYNITWDQGTLFPRWSPDWAFGYGYPFFNIYAPGATFLGTLLYRILPLSLEAAVKGAMISTILLSAWSMWFFMRDWLGERAALVAAVAYVYAPYHLLDVYVRAAMAESLALAFLPLALWGVRRAVLRPGPSSIALAALGYAAVHLSSNLVALLFTPVLGLYLLVLAYGQVRDKTGARAKIGGWVRAMIPAGAGLILGVTLAAFFILPALTESKFVNLDQWFAGYYDFHDHFVYFSQLFDPRWGFGISTPGPNDTISYQLGLVLFALAALAFWRWLRRDTGEQLEIGFWLLVLAGSVGLTTSASAWAWDHIPMVDAAQFPWRYLTLSALALAALAPAALLPQADDPSPSRSWLPPLLLAGLIILGSAPYLRIETPDPPPGGATLAGLMEFERSSDEMTGMTATATEIAAWSPLADLHMAGIPIDNQVDYSLVGENTGLDVDVREHRVDSELVWVHAEGPGQRVPFYRQWYPGWTAAILDPANGAELDRFPLTPADTRPPYGLLDVPVPAGEHLLRISFEDTPIRSIGEKTSIIAVILLLLLLALPLAKRLRRQSPPIDH
ncbi:MAG TPA: hypothetical protein G4N94_03900 [Caldilineae bacterium]|nr:hypothetical protein [Caldilineae bacterium]